MSAIKSYLEEIAESIHSLRQGMGLTWSHLQKRKKREKALSINNDSYFRENDGTVTIQYPHEQIAVPVNGRYRLELEADDCIACNKCARICPVDCIDIEGIKATQELGKTSDGTTKRLYLATFDLDLAKCCYCGLCTVVCPTECLIMTPEYDYSSFELKSFKSEYGQLTAKEAEEKRAILEKAKANKPVRPRKSSKSPSAS